MRGYDGESEITHNATGDKGGSKYQLKGVGQREFDVDVPRTDWDWMIYPKGMIKLCVLLKIILTIIKFMLLKTGLDIKMNSTKNVRVDDDARIDYVKNILKSLLMRYVMVPM